MKKFGAILLASTMIAAFSLTGCGGSGGAAGAASKTEAAAEYSLDLTLEFTENNSTYPDEVTVELDGGTLWKVKKAELHQSIETVAAGNHTILILNADDEKLGETTINVDKDSRVKITLDNDSVNVEMQQG